MLQTLPEDIQQDILDLEYRERFALSAEQFEKEPWEAVYLAQLKWRMVAERDSQPPSLHDEPDDDWGFE